MEEYSEAGQKMFDKALNYLSFKARTEHELREYFEKKKYAQDSIDKVIDKLAEYHYIDDSGYVRQYCETNAFGKRQGRAKLRQDLIRRGISEELLEQILIYVPDEDEAEFARAHFQKAMTKTEGEPYRRRLPRIQNYLFRRGFSGETVSALLREVSEEDCPVDEEKFAKHFDHYLSMYTRKGMAGRELEAKVMRAMLSRGYQFDQVREALERSTEESGD